MRHRLAIAFLLLFVQLFPWAAPARAAASALASCTWMADGAKYASARADGSGYVYKGALVFERGAAGKLSLDAANCWRYSGKEEQQALNSAIDEYKLFSRNCTTTVSDVLNSAGSSVLKGSTI